jgi:hypothetical protein
VHVGQGLLADVESAQVGEAEVEDTYAKAVAARQRVLTEIAEVEQRAGETVGGGLAEAAAGGELGQAERTGRLGQDRQEMEAAAE